MKDVKDFMSFIYFVFPIYQAYSFDLPQQVPWNSSITLPSRSCLLSGSSYQMRGFLGTVPGLIEHGKEPPRRFGSSSINKDPGDIPAPKVVYHGFAF